MKVYGGSKSRNYAAVQYAASFHCAVEVWKYCEEFKPKLREKCFFVDRKREETKHRTERFRKFGKWMRRHLGGNDLVRRLDRQGEVLVRCRKMFGPCETDRPEPMGSQEYRKILKWIQVFERG